MDDAPDDEEAEHEHREHEIVELQAVIEIDEAEETAARDVLDAVFARSVGSLQRVEVDDLRQRPG